jgi:hypothetical protein
MQQNMRPIKETTTKQNRVFTKQQSSRISQQDASSWQLHAEPMLDVGYQAAKSGTHLPLHMLLTHLLLTTSCCHQQHVLHVLLPCLLRAALR